MNKFRNIKKQALNRKIDGVAITDHETIKGGLESKKYSDDNFLFITGQEISTNLGTIRTLCEIVTQKFDYM